MTDIDTLLQPFQRFGIDLGLDRIRKLLADLGNPQQKIPIVHVTGTNGKGSVTAYVASVLTAAGYRVGRYTSPHLIDWTERIWFDGAAITKEAFCQVLEQVSAAIDPHQESPTQFEVITAAAWLYFAQMGADVAVMEVGLGGRLDATNVCDRTLASVITSISREHWQRLGSTLAEIAWEKAGILKPQCPAIIGVLPQEAATVVKNRIQELDCPAIWIEDGEMGRLGDKGTRGDNWAFYNGIEYPLPLLGEFQLHNSAIAIATVQCLQQQGWEITTDAIIEGMAKTQWLGRIQWTTWQNQQILIDGAHNPASAVALRQYVDTLNQPVNWVMGILATKDHREIFEALLRQGDRAYFAPVPDHTTAEADFLANLAIEVCPQLDSCQYYSELFPALNQAISDNENGSRLTVLCGSLYLIGYFLKHQTCSVVSTG